MRPQIKQNEDDVFYNLEKLCAKEGYIYALSYLQARHGFWAIPIDLNNNENINILDDTFTITSNEFQLLHGLIVKNKISYNSPKNADMDEYIKSTYILLKELHTAINDAIIKNLLNNHNNSSYKTLFDNGSNIREPVFYGGDSAFDFQFKEFSGNLYKNDEEWLLSNKGFTVSDALLYASSIKKIIEKNYLEQIKLYKNDLCNTRFLNIFKFSTNELIAYTNKDKGNILKFLTEFSLYGAKNYNNISDFNITKSKPIIKINDCDYICFRPSALLQSIYKSPSYWMLEDKSYHSKLAANRGAFTEDTVYEFCKKIFGGQKVFKNINLKNSKKNTVSEIDVIVIHSECALVFQCKSKKMTLAAQAGDKNKIDEDFKKAVQNSYDQALSCGKAILEEQYNFEKAKLVKIFKSIKSIIPITILSDSYPALSSQARNFLNYETKYNNILPPVVTDIFFIDALVEFLKYPYQFLKFIKWRSCNFNRLVIVNEFSTLGFYLKGDLSLLKTDKESNIGPGEDLSEELNINFTKIRTKSQNFVKKNDMLIPAYNNVTSKKLQRNHPCHCGSGIKYKKCCLYK